MNDLDPRRNVVIDLPGGASLSAASIVHNFDAISFRPEVRARAELADVAAAIETVRKNAHAIAARAEAPFDVEAEVAAFAAAFVRMKRAAWAADGRTMSSMVVGPSKFPVERNRKRVDAAMKRHAEAHALIGAWDKRMKRAAFPHGDPRDGIRSDRPDAVVMLEKKLAALEARQEAMKKANAAWAALAKDPENPKAKAALAAVPADWIPALQRFKPLWSGDKPYTFALKNNGAEIRRCKARIEEIQKEAARHAPAADGAPPAPAEQEIGGARVVENADAMRLQIFFPGKPDAARREKLKAHGFRWAPSEGAWQRLLNNAARYAAKQVLA